MDADTILEHARRRLAEARTIEQVQQVVRTAARQVTGAQGATFVLRDGDRCFYADEDAISPLWKGQRFPIDHCISGWAMLNRQPAVIADIAQDDRIPQAAYAPTFVRSLIMVPIGTTEPAGAIGAYWSTNHSATQGEQQRLTELAEATDQALRRLLPAATVPHRPSLKP